jgi:hypothetical protein
MHEVNSLLDTLNKNLHVYVQIYFLTSVCLRLLILHLIVFYLFGSYFDLLIFALILVITR